jgi:hypothetical protein
MLATCKFCAVVFFCALMLVLYCVLAWWMLAEPSPPLTPHVTPGSSEIPIGR